MAGRSSWRAPRYRLGRRDRRGTVRSAGCQRIFISARKALSLTVAVGRRRILRVEREEQDPLAALPPAAHPSASRSTDCRSASPSRPTTSGRSASAFGHRSRPGCACRCAGSSRSSPCSRSVHRPCRPCAGGCSSTMPNRIGYQTSRDHSITRWSVRNSLQIAPHRPVVGAIGRAEIDQQHADLLRV